MQVHTKYLPDFAALATLDAAATRSVTDRSRTRLRRPALDLVQFHWWDYTIDRYVEVAQTLDALRKEASSKTSAGSEKRKLSGRG